MKIRTLRDRVSSCRVQPLLLYSDLDNLVFKSIPTSRPYRTISSSVSDPTAQRPALVLTPNAATIVKYDPWKTEFMILLPSAMSSSSSPMRHSESTQRYLSSISLTRSMASLIVFGRSALILYRYPSTYMRSALPFPNVNIDGRLHT